ncbi:hypothetical protein COCSUDRAFT_58648 [Coccomyxa subellipsoidea C-169]|uniref:Uncharacterized protein n=1 Tax=Coccomyxa subellipsoidea (strain C-169) TaxID=574566 RepID=I0YLT7_COCSC|nr:hypothetical protein COCSUDRAFT_58648 [Coccomyxa subellipsoidea C-169]EIE19356.1 hypothetical protein COCSUDRAFT_58648 [Coccomyxa subellipsoidea C-169]|eukprot:XP_005643900.1 hypothetical protein COCSUDRAFT_58648 [Coccomyxa subellipsoidea C-169]
MISTGAWVEEQKRRVLYWYNNRSGGSHGEAAWENGDSWGSAGVRKSPPGKATPPRPSSATLADMPRTGSASATKSMGRIAQCQLFMQQLRDIHMLAATE